MERSRSSYEVHVDVYENYLIISMKNKSPACSCWLGRNIFFLVVPRKAVTLSGTPRLLFRQWCIFIVLKNFTPIQIMVIRVKKSVSQKKQVRTQQVLHDSGRCVLPNWLKPCCVCCWQKYIWIYIFNSYMCGRGEF